MFKGERVHVVRLNRPARYSEKDTQTNILTNDGEMNPLCQRAHAGDRKCLTQAMQVQLCPQEATCDWTYFVTIVFNLQASNTHS